MEKYWVPLFPLFCKWNKLHVWHNITSVCGRKTPIRNIQWPINKFSPAAYQFIQELKFFACCKENNKCFNCLAKSPIMYHPRTKCEIHSIAIFIFFTAQRCNVALWTVLHAQNAFGSLNKGKKQIEMRFIKLLAGFFFFETTSPCKFSYEGIKKRAANPFSRSFLATKKKQKKPLRSFREMSGNKN